MRSNLLIGLGGVGLVAAAVAASGMSTASMQQGTLPAAGVCYNRLKRAAGWGSVRP